MSLPDRVFRLIGNKPRLGAGRPSSLIIVGDSLPVFIGPPPYPRPCGRAPPFPRPCSRAPPYPRPRCRVPPYPRPALPVPVRQGPVGDSLTAFIIAPPYTRPQCRPPRRTMASIGVMAQMFCDAGDSRTQFTTATPPHPGLDGGFCSIRSLPSACRRRVAPLMVQFPPFGGDVTGRQVTHGSPYGATPPACCQ